MRHRVAFDDPKRIPYAHGKVGVAAMSVLWAQPLNALLRPHPGIATRRRAWEYAHALLGRTALTLGAMRGFGNLLVFWSRMTMLHMYCCALSQAS